MKNRWEQAEENRHECRQNLEEVGITRGKTCAGGGCRVGVTSEPVSSFFDNRTQREWLSTEEAAHFLSISPNALRIMVHRDQIRAFKLGRRLRFRVQDCRGLFRKKGE
jgi:excisionase family DNA binding protein